MGESFGRINPEGEDMMEQEEDDLGRFDRRRATPDDYISFQEVMDTLPLLTNERLDEIIDRILTIKGERNEHNRNGSRS